MSFFSICVVALWKDRNNLVFANKSKMGEEQWKHICYQVTDIEKELNNPLNFTDTRRVRVNLSWQSPPTSFFKVNIDGAYNIWCGSSTCGGLIRDDKGTFVKGFYGNLGACSALIAEFKAPLHGIKVARSLGLEESYF